MGTSGDKIVLLDGMGSGSGSATNGLLSMIPGMFANLIGGNKMDPNLVAALALAMVLVMVMSVALMVFQLN